MLRELAAWEWAGRNFSMGMRRQSTELVCELTGYFDATSGRRECKSCGKLRTEDQLGECRTVELEHAALSAAKEGVAATTVHGIVIGVTNGGYACDRLGVSPFG